MRRAAEDTEANGRSTEGDGNSGSLAGFDPEAGGKPEPRSGHADSLIQTNRGIRIQPTKCTQTQAETAAVCGVAARRPVAASTEKTVTTGVS